MDPRVPSLFAVCVALLLVANPVYLFPHAGQSEYTHDIEPVSASEVPAEADVLQYSDLSPAARAAIEDARTDDGVVYGEANKPPEFFYSDYADLNRGIYYVKQGDSYYRLTTHAGGGLFPVDLFLQWALVLLGLGVGLVGYGSLRDHRRWLPAGVGVYGGLVLLGAVFQPGSGAVTGVDTGPILLLALAGIVATLVVFGAIADRPLVRRTTAAFGIPLVVGAGLLLLPPSLVGDLPGPLVSPLPLAGLAVVPLLVLAGHLGQAGYRRAVA